MEGGGSIRCSGTETWPVGLVVQCQTWPLGNAESLKWTALVDDCWLTALLLTQGRQVKGQNIHASIKRENSNNQRYAPLQCWIIAASATAFRPTVVPDSIEIKHKWLMFCKWLPSYNHQHSEHCCTWKGKCVGARELPLSQGDKGRKSVVHQELNQQENTSAYVTWPKVTLNIWPQATCLQGIMGWDENLRQII